MNLQTSMIAGTTANVRISDPETERLYLEAVGDTFPTSYVRIGRLIDGCDRWWLRDPNGPAELSEAVRTYALPYFERPWPLEVQAQEYGRARTKWSVAPHRIYLALTLYRLREIEEARAALANPPRLTSPSWLERIEAARQWLDRIDGDGARTPAT